MKFSDPIGPTYHYEEQTNTTLGDQPNLRDPLENKYFSIKKSKFTGEGAFATRYLPANTIYANYGGFSHTKYEDNLYLTPRLHEKIRANHWTKDNLDYEKELTYKYV